MYRRLWKKAYTLEGHHGLRRCASFFVIAAYVKIRLIPQNLRALHINLFAKPFIIDKGN